VKRRTSPRASKPWPSRLPSSPPRARAGWSAISLSTTISGVVEVKGIAAPVPAWQALRPSVVASPPETLRGSALTRLVGRDEEIDLLLRPFQWRPATDGASCLSYVNRVFGTGTLTRQVFPGLPNFETPTFWTVSLSIYSLDCPEETVSYGVLRADERRLFGLMSVQLLSMNSRQALRLSAG
jgi:hypothetical protein